MFQSGRERAAPLQVPAWFGGREERLQKMGPATTTTTTMAGETMPSRDRREKWPRSDSTPGRRLGGSRPRWRRRRVFCRRLVAVILKRRGRTRRLGSGEGPLFLNLRFAIKGIVRTGSSSDLLLWIRGNLSEEPARGGTAGKRRWDGTTRFVSTSVPTIICHFQISAWSCPSTASHRRVHPQDRSPAAVREVAGAVCPVEVDIHPESVSCPPPFS